MQAIIFDLDGTLIDSAPDIRAAVNTMLESLGEPPMPLPEVTSFIGNGLPHLVRLVMQARQIDPALHETLTKRTLAAYHIADVLDMTVEDAQTFFAAVPSICEKMDALVRVGLGYIKVGQQATTLSGGEAQRVKLSKELARRSTGRTLYILDEPTTGLHFEDVRKLLEVLHELVDQGNSVVVIEHNLDVVKTADWIIDIGPEGGDGGGQIVAEGTPDVVAANVQSHTGRYLKPLLERKRTAAE